MFFSFRMLAWGWAGLAGVAAVGAGALQASYVAPPAPVPPILAEAEPPARAALPGPASVPFENRSLLAMLPPPGIRPHAVAPPRVAEPLPVPPVPPVRVARLEPRRAAPTRGTGAEPAYAEAEPAYPSWPWRNRLPYPGQYASGRGYYYGGQPGYYGWPGMY